MAERRMVSKTIMQTQKFLRLPLETQALYVHLVINSDDDGIVEAFPVVRMIGASEDSLGLLVIKQFIKPLNQDMVYFITDFNEQNKIRPDRHKPSIHRNLAIQQLGLEVEGSRLVEPGNEVPELPEGSQTIDGQVTDKCPHSIGKDSIGKDSVYSGCDKSQPTRTHFTPPTLEEVKAYCIERNNNIDAEYFIDFQEARGWVLSNGKKMKDWKATIRTWERNNYNRKPVNKNSKEDAINVVNNLMSKLGGDGNEQSATDTESTIDVTASVHY